MDFLPMAFHEKSAWLMAVSLLLAGGLYYWVVVTLSIEVNRPVPPLVPLVVAYTVLLTVLAVVGHIAIAVLAPRNSSSVLDERERLIARRASHAASYVMGVGTLVSLGIYLFYQSGDLLFHSVFASLMLSQISEYLVQIVYFRTSV
ncbi:MAG: hypothetical protein AAF756_00705 [Pseudomonadota bacterium]